MNIKCFLIQETGLTHRFFRRYVSLSNEENKCPLPHGYHDASTFIDKGLLGEATTSIKDRLDLTDPRWPKQCGCGYVFQDNDEWQLYIDREYARADNEGVIFCGLNQVPDGAIWRAEWYEDMPEYRGLDGKCYVVKTPGGNWIIDSRASNCTKPDDTQHKCWCRHGEAPNFTVDKNGITCAAGAGSIMIGNYHGFLINGELTCC